MLYFDADKLDAPKGEYVLWCDGMGTGRALVSSLSRAANFIFKLHRAFEIATTDISDVKIYPIMDGVYVTTSSQRDMRKIILKAFLELTDEFVRHRDDKMLHKFMVRGGLAYGATLHGADISESAFADASHLKEFKASKLNEIRSMLLLSSAMKAAYDAEWLAPPFGIYVDSSALSIPQLVNRSDKGFQTGLYKWWEDNSGTPLVEVEVSKVETLAREVYKHLEESRKRTLELDYPIDSINRHASAVKEYFYNFFDNETPKEVK